MGMTLETLRTQYRDFIVATAAERGVTDIRVFGSVARGEAGQGSDVDLLVRTQDGVGHLTLAQLERVFEEQIGVPVQLVAEASVDALLKERIFTEATAL